MGRNYLSFCSVNVIIVTAVLEDSVHLITCIFTFSFQHGGFVPRFDILSGKGMVFSMGHSYERRYDPS